MSTDNARQRSPFWRNRFRVLAPRDARLLHHVRRLFGCLLVAALLVAGQASGASAAQHQEANSYAHWNLGGHSDIWMIDQQIAIGQLGHHSFVALLWTYTGTQEGGYLGYQTSASRPDGSVGDTVVYSLWSANGARGTGCGTQFAGAAEGTGMSCRLALHIPENTFIRLRLWRLEQDAGGQGQWWGAWVATAAGDIHIGDLRVPAANHASIRQVSNFLEYWGEAVPCQDVPQSVVLLTQPAANLARPGAYRVYTSYSNLTKGRCGNGSATPLNYGWTRGVRLTLGGR